MRCPVCRAEAGPGPPCRRCRADLSLLFSLEDQRRAALQGAYEALSQGRGPSLLDWAQQAHILRRDEESGRLLILGYLLCRDFAEAWRLYSGHQAQTPSTEQHVGPSPKR
jgi:hypothetical protein